MPASRRDDPAELGTGEFMNPGDEGRAYVHRSRQRKAVQMAFLAWAIGIPVVDVALMGNGQWSLLAKAAGVTEPHAVTRALTLERLAKFEMEGALTV